METTANLALPYIMASQAQKHVTYNEALRMLDAVVQLSIASRTATQPATTPVDGERHIVASGATGGWSGWDGDVACYVDGGWMRLTPQTGWLAWVEDEGLLVVRTEDGWVQPGASAAVGFDGIGIRTGADATNRLAVKSDAALFSHDDVTPGSGDMRITLNRSGSAKDAGFVFQNDWSSRALFGLLGDENFRIKVSPDGSAFHDALTVDSSSGAVTLGPSLLSAAGDGIRAHRNVQPATDNARSLGTGTHRWSVVHAATGTISTSDRRRKDEIDAVPAGLAFVRDLEPVRYRLKGGARMHFGLIAQQVRATLDTHGIDDFAGWTLADPGNPDSDQGLRYEEFLPILIRAIQELAADVDRLREAAG